MGEAGFIDPVADKVLIEEIIDTVINNTGYRFYGGAKARIKAQLPSIIMSKQMLIDELDKAFT